MKKMLIMLLVAILTLSATAFAATYTHEDDIRFEYSNPQALDAYTEAEVRILVEEMGFPVRPGMTGSIATTGKGDMWFPGLWPPSAGELHISLAVTLSLPILLS